MTVSGRHIHVAKVSLRAPLPAVAQRFRHDFEDALRTAAWPGQQTGTLLLVRRLKLGRLRAGLSRQALSAHLTQCLAETPIAVLRWDAAPPPPDAEVVLIPDIVTAAAFALRAALDGDPPHWAVARVFVQTTQTADASAQIVVILRALIDTGGAVLPGRIAQLKGGLTLLVRAIDTLPPEHLAQLVTLSKMQPAQPPVAPQVSRASMPDIVSPRARERPTEVEVSAQFKGTAVPLHAAAHAVIARWSADDPRTAAVLGWIALATEGPTGPPRVMQRLARLVAQQNNSTTYTPKTSRIDTLIKSAVHSNSKREITPAPALLRSRTPVQNTDATPPIPDAPDTTDTPLPDGNIHAYAGLWLLIPVLRLIACDHAEEALGLPITRAVLGRFAARLGLAHNDPVYEVLDPDLTCETSITARAPDWAPHPTVLHHIAGQRGLFGHETGDKTALSLRRTSPAFARLATRDLPPDLPLRPTATDTLHDPVTGLTLAGQRLISQLLGGRGWRWLVARRAPVSITPTHIDVVFGGHDADTDVRIAGLDLNPGWVPSLGRVVQFHYDYSSMHPYAGPPDE